MKDFVKISHFILSCYIILAESSGVGGCIWDWLKKFYSPNLKMELFSCRFYTLFK